jgi:hypothetical protein
VGIVCTICGTSASEVVSTRELVTIGILVALKNGFVLAFHCWLRQDYGD